MSGYAQFLAGKAPLAPSFGIAPFDLGDHLSPFQRDITAWAIERGRCAIFADTGLGKTRMQLRWAEQSGARVLIVSPLAVAEQTIEEGRRIGTTVRFCHEPMDVDGIWITNYQKLHKFTNADYDAIVLDESSILASLDGKTRQLLIKQFAKIRRRLCCTATPAPNDIAEIGGHAEFLGIMTRSEMLAQFFVHDAESSQSVGGWRLKGHAREAFWRWVAKWAVYVRKPSDIGHDDEGYILPQLTIRDEVVPHDWRPDGGLFPSLSGGIQGRTAARRDSLDVRVERAASLVVNSSEQWLVWHGLNAEGDALKVLLPDAAHIAGKTSDDDKIALARRWQAGDIKDLITKPSMFGFGLNWQHSHNMIFLGLSDSWQQYYQCIRREWRFGQTEPVNVYIVVGQAEMQVAANIRRKEADAAELAAGIIAAVKEAQLEELQHVHGNEQPYESQDTHGENWHLMLGDSVDRIKEVEAASVGLSVFSPPFASLYTYSASDRDMGNARDYDEFFQHFDFLIPEMLRVTMPGRRACVHVQQVTMTKVAHGVIGWRDFRADVVRHFVAAGWIYDGEVVIDKDPQAQAIRTKSKALMFVQKNKDSAWSRPAMADYILLFRVPGDNPEPIKNDVSNEEWIMWARPIWYNIRESDTLNAAVARDDADEKHVCPLQLETIERCIRLWSNKGDTVADFFAGIASTGYQSVLLGRKFLGCELKPNYYHVGIQNLRDADSVGAQVRMPGFEES